MGGDPAVDRPRGRPDRVGLGAAGRGGRRRRTAPATESGDGDAARGLPRRRRGAGHRGPCPAPIGGSRRRGSSERRAGRPGAGLRIPGRGRSRLRDGWWRRAAASRCSAGSPRPTAAGARGPAAGRAPTAVWSAPAYELRDSRRPAACRSTTARRLDRADGLDLLPVAPRRPARDRPTWSASAWACAGLRAELAMVLVDGLRRRAARPVDPDRLGHPRRPGDPRGRPPSPAGRRGWP